MYVLIKSEEGSEGRFGFFFSSKPSGLFRRAMYEIRFLLSRFRFRYYCVQKEIYASMRSPRFPVLVLERPIQKKIGEMLQGFHQGCEAVVGRWDDEYFVMCSNDSSPWNPGDMVSVENL